MSEQIIKDCPFCGGYANYEYDEETSLAYNQRFWYGCILCQIGFDVYGSNLRYPRSKENIDRDNKAKEAALLKWNTRVVTISAAQKVELPA